MVNTNHIHHHILSAILAAGVLTACGGSSSLPGPPPGLDHSPSDATTTPQRGAEESTAPSEPTATPEPSGYLIDMGVPGSITASIEPALQEAGVPRVAAAEDAILRVTLAPLEGDTVTEVVYVLAGAFATVPDEIDWLAFQAWWRTGDASGLGFDLAPNLVLTEADLATFTALYGEPAAPLEVVSEAERAAILWDQRPALTLIPFDHLEPALKVISMDGVNPLFRDADMSAYPLTVRVGVRPLTERGGQAVDGLAELGMLPATNRDPAAIQVITLTGVTALVRATATQMELRGYDFPILEIQDELARGDLLHVSNEVSFYSACPEPDWVQDGLSFCSKPAYIETLTLLGVDLVELTGNHINDYGIDPLAATIDRYEDNGMVVFGGGRTLEEARVPRIIPLTDGSRIAFLGCNSAGPSFAYATVETPGAAPCEDFGWVIDTIQSLKANDQADVVIVTLQYFELDDYQPTAQQREDFEALAAAGADIVSGSQAHQPQGFSFVDGRLVHFGVGNLFFDQMDRIENRQLFVDHHVLYRGRHISTVLYTGMMESYAQPRAMTAEERAGFLQDIFTASGW